MNLFLLEMSVTAKLRKWDKELPDADYRLGLSATRLMIEYGALENAELRDGLAMFVTHLQLKMP